MSNVNDVTRKLLQAQRLVAESLALLGAVPASVASTSVPVGDTHASVFDWAALSGQLGVSEEKAKDLFDLRQAVLYLGVKPSGATLPEQRRSLANVLLLGYKYGYGVRGVALSKINLAAAEWNIEGHNFSRDLRMGGIQMRGGGKGKDPLASFAPGSLDPVVAEAKKLLI